MYRMKVIAPYDGMGQLVLAEKTKYPDFDIDVEIADREEGIEIAKNAEAEGYDIILSRGGTAEVIEPHITIPIISIKVSGYDLMRVIRLSQSHIGTLALIGFPHITHSAKTACSLVHADIDIFTISSEDEARELLYELSHKNYNTFIGDVTINRIAQALGLNSILITTGQESLEEAFIEAGRMLSALDKIKEQSNLLHNALQSVHEGLYVFERDNRCVYMNETARNLNMDEVIRDYLPIAWKQSIDILEEKNGVMYQIYSEVNDRLFIFLKEKVVFKKSLTGVSLKNPQNVTVPFGYLNTHNETMKKTIESARVLASLEVPILIIGDMGTGRDQMAYSIHCSRTLSCTTFIQIDCQLIDIADGELEEQLTQMGHVGTWHFENIQSMDKKQQEWLYGLIRQGYFRGSCHLICSGNPSIENLVKNGEFSEALYTQLSSCRLDIPDLSNRAEDVADITSLAINKANAKYGKHVAMIEPDALVLLQQHKWERNIEQLIQFVDTMVMQNDGDVLTVSDVQEAFLEEPWTEGRKDPSKTSWKEELSLDKTLDDIVSDVINTVVKKVNGNQSVAAKRLGISRSTLWRKLK